MARFPRRSIEFIGFMLAALSEPFGETASTESMSFNV